MLNNEKFSEVINFLKQSKFQIALDALKIIEIKYRNYYYFYD